MVYLVEFQLIKEAEKLSVLVGVFHLNVVLFKAGKLELRVIVNVDFHWLWRKERKRKVRGKRKRGKQNPRRQNSSKSSRTDR